MSPAPMVKALSKIERARIRARFDGRCAYCGSILGDRWHVDHVEACRRESHWVVGRGLVRSGLIENPEAARLDNLFPSCAPCNLDKATFTIEQWRTKLNGACGVLQRNHPVYRHAVRFGLVIETQQPVQFYFEQREAERSAREHADRRDTAG